MRNDNRRSSTIRDYNIVCRRRRHVRRWRRVLHREGAADLIAVAVGSGNLELEIRNTSLIGNAGGEILHHQAVAIAGELEASDHLVEFDIARRIDHDGRDLARAGRIVDPNVQRSADSDTVLVSNPADRCRAGRAGEVDVKVERLRVLRQGRLQIRSCS